MMNQSSGVELTADIEEAKLKLERPIRDVHGALQLWNIMTAARRMTAAYAEDLDQLRFEAKIAYTKSIVTEYWRPWSGNENNPGLQSSASSKELRPLTRSAMHDALKELRNCLIAHADTA